MKAEKLPPLPNTAQELPFTISKTPFVRIIPYQKGGHWSNKEKLKYAVFLWFYSEHFEQSSTRRKSSNIFELMSTFLKTRDTFQCRSHHQKMEKQKRSIADILKESQSRHDQRIFDKLISQYCLELHHLTIDDIIKFHYWKRRRSNLHIQQAEKAQKRLYRRKQLEKQALNESCKKLGSKSHSKQNSRSETIHKNESFSTKNRLLGIKSEEKEEKEVSLESVQLQKMVKIEESHFDKESQLDKLYKRKQELEGLMLKEYEDMATVGEQLNYITKMAQMETPNMLMPNFLNPYFGMIEPTHPGIPYPQFFNFQG